MAAFIHLTDFKPTSILEVIQILMLQWTQAQENITGNDLRVMTSFKLNGEIGTGRTNYSSSL